MNTDTLYNCYRKNKGDEEYTLIYEKVKSDKVVDFLGETDCGESYKIKFLLSNGKEAFLCEGVEL